LPVTMNVIGPTGVHRAVRVTSIAAFGDFMPGISAAGRPQK
jgi:hypothetical protein